MNTNDTGIDIKILDVLAKANQSFEKYEIIIRLKDVGIGVIATESGLKQVMLLNMSPTPLSPIITVLGNLKFNTI